MRIKRLIPANLPPQSIRETAADEKSRSSLINVVRTDTTQQGQQFSFKHDKMALLHLFNRFNESSPTGKIPFKIKSHIKKV